MPVTTFNDCFEWKNATLVKALNEIKSLRGIVPICMDCKQIRNDGGYWQRVEQYIEEHSEAKFSHGLCDNCLEKRYAEE